MSNGFFDDEDVVNAQSQVTLLMSNGGRPGPALCEVARSGMLAEAIKQLSWFKLGFELEQEEVQRVDAVCAWVQDSGLWGTLPAF